jgi:hypothetical protein
MIVISTIIWTMATGSGVVLFCLAWRDYRKGLPVTSERTITVIVLAYICLIACAFACYWWWRLCK